MKQIIASLLVGIMLLGSCSTAYASNDTNVNTDKQTVEAIAPGISELGVQLDELYKRVGAELKINYMDVKLIHLLAGGKAIYADQRPNIYNKITVDSINGPFDIKGAKQAYLVEAPWAYCPDTSVSRPSKYYLPDAAYSTTAEVVKLMNDRFYINRGSMQPYFNALKKDVMTNVLFCEATMKYTGSSENAVNNFYTVYEKILYDKGKNENVIQTNTDGTFKIKDKFKSIFIDNGITDTGELNRLALILSFDKNLAVSDNPDSVKDEYVVPYKMGYTSRENMMVAGMSLAGKVRYVWGGGHLTAGNIEGINPIWKAFSGAYPTQAGTDGYNTCVKPTNGWSPITGQNATGDESLYNSTTVTSVKQYTDARKDIVTVDMLNDDKYRKLLEQSVDFSKGIPAYRLDGLDCSGYTSWLYNQVDLNKRYDSSAEDFIRSSGLTIIPYGSDMLPGDIFSWGEHIIVIVGHVASGSKAYVMLEESPNVVKFGVVYYGGASENDINHGMSTAKEANKLLGNTTDAEGTNAYNMDGEGYSTQTSNETINGVDTDISTTTRYAQIGRLSTAFIDENTVLPDYNKTIKEMNAQEIIQHTIDRLPDQYLSGLAQYTGIIFKITKPVVNTVSSKDKVVLNQESGKTSGNQTVQVLVNIGKED